MIRNPMSRTLSLALVLTSTVTVTSCGDDSVVGPEGPDVTRIEITPGAGQLVPQEVLALSATARDANGQAVSNAAISWASSDPAVATVTQDGKVTGVAVGSTTISASVGNVSDNAAISVVSLSISEETFVVDSLSLSLLSDSLERVAGTYRFRASGNAADDLSVGQVLVGVEDGGFLRRIESLSIQGDEVITQTSQATLEDVFESGGFSTTVRFGAGTPSGSIQLQALPVGDVEVLYLAEGVTLNAVASNVELLKLEDVDLCAGLLNDACPQGLELRIPSGGIWFDPEFTVEADYGLFTGLESVNLEANGSLDAHVDLYAHAEAEFSDDGEKRLARLARNFVVNTPAGIPIVMQLVVEVHAGFVANAFAETTVESGVEGHVYASLTADYRAGRSPEPWVLDWPSPAELKPDFQQRETWWDYGANANVQVYVRPELEVRMYWALGGSIGLFPYLEAAGSLQPGNWSIILYGGVDHQVDLDFTVLGKEILGHHTDRVDGYRTEIFRASGTFGAGQIYGTARDMTTLAAIPGAALELRGPNPGESSATTTDATGRFEFENVGSGTYELEVSHPDFEQNTAFNLRVVELDAGDVVQVDFQLAPKSSGLQVANVAGRVLDEDGAPVAGAAVQISGGTQTNGFFKSTTTELDGTYVLGGVVLTEADTGLPIESFTVVASKSGYAPATQSGIALAPNTTLTNLDFTLLPPGPVTIFFADGFESGLDWSVDGMWNRTSGAGIVNEAWPTYVDLAPDDESQARLPSAPEGVQYVWYGSSATGNFIGEQVPWDEPKSGGTSYDSNEGTLISQPIPLPSEAPTISLSFQTWFEVESKNPNDEGYDLMLIAVLDESTGLVTELAKLNPAVDPELPDRVSIPFTSGGFNRNPVFRPVFVALDEFAGTSVRLVFTFRTVDHLYNGFRGWLVDNIQVAQAGQAAKSSDALVHRPGTAAAPRH